MKLTKKELIDLTYQNVNGINKNVVNSIINRFLFELNRILSSDQEVDIELRGFGVFKKRKRKDVQIFNPVNNEKKLFSGLYTIRFKKSKQSKVKNEVNSNE